MLNFVFLGCSYLSLDYAFNPFLFTFLVDMFEQDAAPTPQWVGPPAYSPASIQLPPPPPVLQIQEIQEVSEKDYLACASLIVYR